MASVLVVDDDPTLLRIIETVLRSAGLDVSARDTGQAALRAAHARRPDCAVLDASLDALGHDMTAPAVCHALRTAGDTADVPILLLTERGRWLEVAAAFDAGADDYLPKPFSAQDLLHRVEALTL
ncbi:response regulator [Actinoplanes sp. NEAU-A12]|uniref:Response regulator n=1 Tax=Actinoplanes sandaracinus TaxID=3045177 RepID=A0ABT6WBM2_9ACTN|nr:response regulator [Actinoplanes sandaracinus]MDI6097110.1 response regulator [Actinoplanes sandaracinus]